MSRSRVVGSRPARFGAIPGSVSRTLVPPLALIAALVVLASVAAPQVQAAEYRYPAKSASAGVAVFKLARLDPRDVVSARVVGSRAGRPATRTVRSGPVRRAARTGTLRVGVPRSWRSKVSLRVRTKRHGSPGSAPASTFPAPSSAFPAPTSESPVTASIAPDSSSTPSGSASTPSSGASTPSAGAATPSAGAAPCGPGVGGFGGSARPPACWRPYASTSPFNTALPASPTIGSGSRAVVARLLGFGSIEDLTAGKATSSDNDYGRPAYFATSSDPTFTVHCTETWGTCPIEGQQVRIPDPATAASGSDGHLSVVDQASGWEYDFWRVASKPAGGGTLRISWGGRTRIDGDGLGSGATAAEFGSMAGVLRLEELKAGRVDHALFIYARCDSGRFVYPATKSGQACSELGESNSGAPAMGTRFQLDMSDTEISALGVPVWKQAILRAMARYGLIMGDTGSVWGLKEESARVYTSFGLGDQWVNWAGGQQGVKSYSGKFFFDLASGVDWQQRLRVVAPCVSQGTC